MNRSLLIVAMFCSASTFAQSPVIDNAVIDNSGMQYQGNLSVNQAAGDLQQQANARAIAVGQSASATTQIRQRLHTKVDPRIDAQSNIQGNSFSNGSGALGVNQSSGASNQQANAMRISISSDRKSVV